MELDKKNKLEIMNNQIGRKGRELWFPIYAPHIDIKTGRSILMEMYLKYPKMRIYEK